MTCQCAGLKFPCARCGVYLCRSCGVQHLHPEPRSATGTEIQAWIREEDLATARAYMREAEERLTGESECGSVGIAMSRQEEKDA